jgi:hypothetical protein
MVLCKSCAKHCIVVWLIQLNLWWCTDQFGVLADKD